MPSAGPARLLTGLKLILLLARDAPTRRDLSRGATCFVLKGLTDGARSFGPRRLGKQELKRS
jgi:hypothetical protein